RLKRVAEAIDGLTVKGRNLFSEGFEVAEIDKARKFHLLLNGLALACALDAPVKHEYRIERVGLANILIRLPRDAALLLALFQLGKSGLVVCRLELPGTVMP